MKCCLPLTRVADIALNRPHRRNALTGRSRGSMRPWTGGRRDDVRVVLLHGAGGALCAG